MERKTPEVGDLAYSVNDINVITNDGTKLLQSGVPFIIVSCEKYITHTSFDEVLLWQLESILPCGNITKLIVRKGLITNLSVTSGYKLDTFDILFVQRIDYE